MSPGFVARSLEAVQSLWPMANDAEITLEANPTSVEAGRFSGDRSAGVNRVSLGIQSLSDPDLVALGRLHSVADAHAALSIANKTFDRVSFDLIYARQHQTLHDWCAELKSALRMATGHLSLYQLTIEPGTAFGDRLARGALRGLPKEDLGADMYLATQEICAAHGMPGYEVSNHATPGSESRHNLVYWRGGDYVGIGPGAHGRLSLNGRRFATQTRLSPEEWLMSVENRGSGELPRHVVSDRERSEEYLMMSLRLREGADLARLSTAFVNASFVRGIAELGDLGLVVLQDDRLSLTPHGRPVLNAVLRSLLAAADRC